MFNLPSPQKPSLLELDNRMAGVEASVKVLEDSAWVLPVAGDAPNGVKFNLAPWAPQTAQLGSGSPVSLTTGTYSNIVSKVLPAGNYLCMGVVSYRALSGSVGMTFGIQAIATASATLPADGEYSTGAGITLVGALGVDLPTAWRFISLPTGGTIYLIGRAGWSSGSGVNAFGKLMAFLLPS